MEETRTTQLIAERAAAKPIEGKGRQFKNTISIDLAAYMPLLEDSEASDEDKLALIETLHTVLLQFVDLGFGVRPSACGQVNETNTPSPQAASSGLDSNAGTLVRQFAGSDIQVIEFEEGN